MYLIIHIVITYGRRGRVTIVVNAHLRCKIPHPGLFSECGLELFNRLVLFSALEGH